jgi:hypothetical protein
MDKHTIRKPSAAACTALLAAVVATSAPAQDGASEDADDDPPRVAQTCLNHPSIKRTKILNDRNIVFITRDDTIYNNQLPRQCPSLKRGSLVNYAIEHSRLCAGGQFQVLWQLDMNRYAPAFVCQLGTFVPITEDELETLTAMTKENRSRRSARRSKGEAVTTEEVDLPPAEPN